MKSDRKNFLKQVAIGGAGLAIPGQYVKPGNFINKLRENGITNPIGCSTYSFGHFGDDRLTIEEALDEIEKIGFDGCEILLSGSDLEGGEIDNEHLQKIKKKAFRLGLDLMGLSTHQSFMSTYKEEREKNIELTKYQIEIAYRLGIPTMRIQTGHWEGAGSFDDLMANEGVEEPPEGYTQEDGFKWIIDCIQQCIPKAKECGVTLGLENHWGLGRKPEWLKKIREGVDSPWLKFTADTGNFKFEDDQYEALKTVAPHTVLLQAKTYFGGGLWFDNRLDFERVAKIFHDVGYKGYISLEFEGKEDPMKAVPKSLKELRSSFS